MKKRLLALIAGALALAPLMAHAAIIDIGPPNDRVIGDIWLPYDAGITSFAGQTVSFDITFANNEFIRILPTTTKAFDCLLLIPVSLNGHLDVTRNSTYTFDQNGQRNSAIFSFGGSYDTAQDGTMINYILGAVFPMFADKSTIRTDVDTLDFYGIHFDLTLPNLPETEILGGAQMLFSASGGDQWVDSWAIGPHVPEGGSTAGLLGLGLTALAAIKKFR